MSVLLIVRHFPSDVALHPRTMEASNFRSLLNTSVAGHLTLDYGMPFNAHVKSELFTDMSLKVTVFQDVTLCHLLSRSPSFKAL
jgi:hypothetical protein